MNEIKHHFGWRPDLPDQRDRKYSAPVFATMPPSVDLRLGCPRVYDQGNLGSCTAQGVAGIAQFLLIKQHLKSFIPSRLFIYYNERVMEGSVDYDSGAYIRDGIKVAAAYLPHESLWWQNNVKFTVKPNKRVYADGLHNKIANYQALDNTNLNQLKGCLADGYPFVFGFTVYQSFETSAVASTGVVPMPQPNEQILGGHCVTACGYEDATQRFLVRNSWSANWGMGGYCTMPFAYLTNPNLASDFWMAHTVIAS